MKYKSFLMIITSMLVASTILVTVVYFNCSLMEVPLNEIMEEKTSCNHIPRPETWADFGSGFNISIAIFSGLAFIAMAATLAFQMRAIDQQNETQELQRFENKFFEMLSNLRNSLRGTVFPYEFAIKQAKRKIPNYNPEDIKVSYIERGDDAYTHMYLGVCDLESPDFKYRINYKRIPFDPQKDQIEWLIERFNTLMTGHWNYYIEPLFYRFMKIMEFILYEKQISGVDKCRYTSMLLDELSNSEIGLLLFYFIARKERHRDGRGNTKDIKNENYFAKIEEFRFLMADCNIFRHLKIDDHWRKEFIKFGIPKAAFCHPSIKANPNIAKVLYKKNKQGIIRSIIHPNITNLEGFIGK